MLVVFFFRTPRSAPPGLVSIAACLSKRDFVVFRRLRSFSLRFESVPPYCFDSPYLYNSLPPFYYPPPLCLSAPSTRCLDIPSPPSPSICLPLITPPSFPSSDHPSLIPFLLPPPLPFSFANANSFPIQPEEPVYERMPPPEWDDDGVIPQTGKRTKEDPDWRPMTRCRHVLSTVTIDSYELCLLKKMSHFNAK